jgi:hypothetical protein
MDVLLDNPAARVEDLTREEEDRLEHRCQAFAYVSRWQPVWERAPLSAGVAMVHPTGVAARRAPR